MSVTLANQNQITHIDVASYSSKEYMPRHADTILDWTGIYRETHAATEYELCQL